MNFSYSKLAKSPTAVKLGGFDDEVLVAVVDDVTSMPALPTTQTSEQDKVLATGAFTFKTGVTGFRSVMAQTNSVGLTPEVVGPEDSKCYKQNAKFSIAGDSLLIDAFISDANSYKFIVAIKKGDYYTIIGTISRPATISPKPNYGQKAEDGVVHEFDVLCYSNTPALKFAGPIAISDAVQSEDNTPADNTPADSEPEGEN